MERSEASTRSCVLIAESVVFLLVAPIVALTTITEGKERDDVGHDRGGSIWPDVLMAERHFPPPWSVEDNRGKNWHVHPSIRRTSHDQSASLQ